MAQTRYIGSKVCCVCVSVCVGCVVYTTLKNNHQEEHGNKEEKNTSDTDTHTKANI